MTSMKTRNHKDYRIEELLCYETLPDFIDPAAPAPEPKVSRKSNARSRSRADGTTSGGGYIRGPYNKRRKNANSALDPDDPNAKWKKRRKASKKAPTVHFGNEQADQVGVTSQSAAAAAAAPDLDELSRHVMCDWSDLRLGERTGSGAWNTALRTQLIRSHQGVSNTPQLSSTECLYRVQQSLNHIPTLLPPENSFLVDLLDETPANGNQKTTHDNGEEDKKQNPKESKSRTMMRDLYRSMMQQEVDDGSALRRDLRFTTVTELRDRFRNADEQVTCLSAKERGIRELLSSRGLLNGDMQQRIARIRGVG